MKKRFTVFIATWVVCLTAFVGCAEKEDKGLYGSNLEIDGESNMRVVFRTEKSKIKIGDDLKVQIFYGPVNDYDSYSENHILEDYTPTFKMDSDAYVIENNSFVEIDVIFSKELHDFPNCFYDWDTDAEQSKGVETIVISSESFAAQAGGFRWAVTVSIHYSDTNGERHERRELGNVGLYYLKQEDEILLFNNVVDFRKHIKK